MTHRLVAGLLVLQSLPLIGGCVAAADGGGSGSKASDVATVAGAVSAGGAGGTGADAPIAAVRAAVTAGTAATDSAASGRFAATATTAGDSAGVPASDAAALLAAIRREIGAASCTADTQCRTLGVGWKACGGPEGQLPWSVATASGDRLAAIAADQQQARRRDVERSGMVSNCVLSPDPGAVCLPTVDGKRSCQLRRPAGGGALVQ